MAIKVSKIISINELNNNEPSAESLVLLRKNDVDGYSTVQQLEDYFSFVKQDEYQEKVAELEAANTELHNPVETSGNKPGLMTVADKNKLDAIQTQANNTSATSNSATFTTENNNNNTLNITDTVATTEAYNIGSVTPGTGDSSVVFKGKNTTYGKATNEKYGLVKLGDNTSLEPINSANKIYPVQATEGGNLGVYVPWKDDQKLPVTHLAVADKNNATDNAAVSTGPVYINTYDVKDGEPSKNTSAISIEGKNGISVTADNGGKIEISGHEKPPVLTMDNSKNSNNGNLVPIPSDQDITESAINNTAKYLKANGTWDTPADTKVMFKGKESGTGRNKKYTSIGVDSTCTSRKVTSLIAGTSITLESDAAGNLTINGPDTGVALTNGTGITIGTDNSINLQPATNNTIGGIKAGNIVGSSGKLDNITIGNSTSQTIYAPQANGKYYPIEIVGGTGSATGHAVVKIPDVPSPFYEEGTTANDKFTFAFEQYKVAYYWGAPIFAFTGDKNGPAFNNSLTAYNTIMNNNGGHAISQEEVADITSSSFMGLTITCPSNVIFAQLDRPIYTPATPGYTMNGSIISTIAGDKQQISIQNSNPAIGFPVDSITPDNPGYAFLKFATAAHTYNATVQITATIGRTGTIYTVDIII